jgi:hypothetical protein
MKRLVVIGGIAALVVFGVQYFKKTDRKAFQEHSKERVQKLFDNLKSGRTADQQDAVGYWRVGHPEGTTEAKLQDFERFLKEKNIPMKIKSYEFVSSELVEGEDVVNRYVLLNCKVDDRSLSMMIRHKTPIRWAD